MIRSLLFLLIFTSNLVFSQTLTTTPASFSAEEEVTFVFDVMGNDKLEQLDQAWVWAWAPGNGDAPSNVNPANEQAEPARLTKRENSNQWVITFVPADFLNLEPIEIDQLGILLKGRDWSDGQTQDFIFNVNPPSFYIQITQPSSDPSHLVEENTLFTLAATTNELATIDLIVDGEVIASQDNTTQIEIETSFQSSGNKIIVAHASRNDEVKTDTLKITVYSPPSIIPLPSNMKLGVNYDPQNSQVATFVLQAPRKEIVHLIGDFNNWEVSQDFMMNKTPDGELFWLTVGDLSPQREYVYQFLIDGRLKVADPYCDKISDPWDDRYIPEESYPGLIDYPYEKTEYRASVMQTGQSDYIWEVENFESPDKEDLVIYELLIRDFSEARTYSSVIDSLDYLQSLGINALELMPVNEFEGNLSWGYNPNFYFAPDKFYGTKNDLKSLIDECHKRGFAVIIDMVLNHSFNSSPLARMYWDEDANRPSFDNPWYNAFHNFENSAAHWGSDFNHESAYTQAFTDSVNTYWITEYKVDGFRFDFTKGFGNNFKPNSTDSWGSKYDADRIRLLKRMVDKIRAIDPDNIISFEHLSDNNEEKELTDYGIMLWGNMNWAYKRLGVGNNDNLEWSIYSERGWQQNNLISYMESHDEERVMYEILQNGKSSSNYDTKEISTALDRVKLNSSFFFSLPGAKMLWQYQELGFDYSINYCQDGSVRNDCRLDLKPVPSNYLADDNRRKLYDIFSELIKIKKNNSDLFNNGDLSYSLDQLQKWIKLSYQEKDYYVFGNFSTESSSFTLNLPNSGEWLDVFSGNSFDLERNETIELLPGEFHILTNFPVNVASNLIPSEWTPFREDIPTGINDELSSFATIFPNPAKDIIYLNLKNNYSIEVVTISSIDGKRLKKIYGIGSKALPISLKGIESGLYYLNVFSHNKKYSIKFLKI